MDSHAQYLMRNATITMNTLFVEEHHSLDVFLSDASITLKVGGSSVSFLCGSPDALRMFVHQLTLAIKEEQANTKTKENHVN